MARAIVTLIEQAYKDEDGVNTLQVSVMYFGADVPGTFKQESIPVNISAVTTTAQLGTAVASKVRSTAVVNGYTVPASQVLLPSFSAA